MTFRGVLSGSTMPTMSAKRNKNGKGKYKPYKAARIPMHVAKLLKELADEDMDNFAMQVRRACRNYLILRGKLPKPSGPSD